MAVFTKKLVIQTSRQGMFEFTDLIQNELDKSGLTEGSVVVFCCHTSASLVIMENADPSAQHDLEGFINRLVPDDDPHFTHVFEGRDDMPSHVKMALTRTTEVIPFIDGRLALGTWQGVFLWEHRIQPHNRKIVLSFQGRSALEA
jgi:secondary thiamine-phosphate synthase enzyme